MVFLKTQAERNTMSQEYIFHGMMVEKKRLPYPHICFAVPCVKPINFEVGLLNSDG